MIKNLTTDVTYATMTLAIAGLPTILDQNYHLEVTGEPIGIAKFTYGGNCGEFKLTISSPDNSVIDGGGLTAVTFSGIYRQTVEFSGFSIINFVNGGVFLDNTYATSEYLISNCTISGSGNKGVRCARAVNLTLTGCTITSTVSANYLVAINPANSVIIRGCTLGEPGLTPARSVDTYNIISLLVEDSTFYGASGAALYLKNITGQCLVKRCQFFDGVGDAVLFSSGITVPVLVQNSLMVNHGSSTFPTIYSNGSVLDVTLENNTITSDLPTFSTLVKLIAANTLVAWNNIVALRNATPNGIIWDIRFSTLNIPASYDSDYNIFYRQNQEVTFLLTTQAWTPNSFYSLQALQAANSIEMHSIQGDPAFGFMDPPNPDYMLQIGSPGRDVGDSSNYQEYDVRKWFRELSGIDIGAYDRDADSSGIPGELSSDAKLSAIYLDGVLLSGFSPTTYTYEVHLPPGTTAIPAISYEKSNAASSVVAGEVLPGFPAEASFQVTAEDGVTVLTYTLTFDVLLSSDATLSDLMIDGASIPGFSPEVHSYTVGLPPETVIIPVVSSTLNDPLSTSMVIVQAPGLPGQSTVTVTAENGTSTLEYTVTFILSVPSLILLSYDGVQVPGFSELKLSYTIMLPFGTTVKPLVKAVGGYQTTVVVTDALDVPGTATIVASSSGIDRTFTISFTVNPEAPPEGIYIESKYQLGDSIVYGNIMSAVNACSPLVRNETIVINTLDEVAPVWLARTNDTEFRLTIKAGTICDAAGLRAKIVDKGVQGVAFSIEQYSNLELINIDMDGSGTLGGCKIGPIKAYNIVFRNCVMGGGDHGFYLYAGEGIEFYDCLAHNFAQYGFHILSFKDVVLDNCDVVFGSLPVNKAWRSDAAPIYISMGSRITIRNCRFTDTSRKFNHVCKITNTDNLLFESCTFSGAYNYTLWFTGSNTPWACTNIEVRDCLFVGNQLASGADTKYGAILVELTHGTKFINNTFAETQVQSFFWDCWGCVSVEIVNNYFYLKRTSSTKLVVVRVRGTAAGIQSEIVVKNNYYDLVQVPEAWTVLSISGSGYATKIYANVAAAQVVGLEIGSGNDFGMLLTPKADGNFLPIVGGPLVGGAAVDYTSAFDARFYEKGAPPHDIGAYETSATPFTESQHTLDFTFVNIGDGLQYDKSAAQVDIPAYDQVHISLDPRYNRHFNNIIIKSRLAPIAIKRTSADTIVLEGNHLLDMNTPFALTIEGSTANDGYYTRPYIKSITYSEANEETLIELWEYLSVSSLDGTLIWENNKVSAFGLASRFSFSERYAHYDLMLVSTKPGFEDQVIYKKDYIRVIQQRPSPNFRLSAYIIFPGDRVTFTNRSVGCDAVAWNIDDPEGGSNNILSNANVISDVAFNYPGSYTVRLTGTNSTPFSRTLTRQGVIKVLDPPSRPFIEFSTSKEVLWHTDTLQLRSSIDPLGTLKVTRFSQVGDNTLWRITRSDTGVLVYTSSELNPTLNWGTDVGGALGAFDVQLIVHNPTWGGVKISKRRILTVYLSPLNRPTYDIPCSRDDLWQDPANNAWYTRSVIDGQVPEAGNKSAYHGVIGPGDVIRLSGYSPELRLRNMQGSFENPILIIPDTSLGPFQIGGRRYEGFRFEGCEYCQLVGTPNDDDLAYGFEFFTDPDPTIYAAAPGNKLINVASFSTNIEVCGCDCHDSKFDGMSAKTDPDLDDPNTWRNGYCTQAPGGFILKDLSIHHNYFHETLGEGIYIGYFEHTKINTITHPITGVSVDVYPHVHEGLKVYRNDFLNNGFDGLQVGNYIGGVEIHDNLVLGAGWQRTFGQCSGFSANYMVGDIYNNTFEGGIVGGVPDGRLRIFNNTFGFGFDAFGVADPIYLDGIYLIQSPMPKWDYSTVPPTITDPTYDYQNSTVYIYHNTIRTPRTPFTLFGYYNPSPREWIMANNLVIYSGPMPPQFSKVPPDESFICSYIQIGTQVGTILKEALSNLHISEADIDTMLFESPDEFKWRVATGSPALLGGVDLKAKWPSFDFADANGFAYPATGNDWYRGAFSFNPLNYEYVVSLAGQIMFRVWSVTRARWIYGNVELVNQINPEVAPDQSGDTVDSNSLVILYQHKE